MSHHLSPAKPPAVPSQPGWLLAMPDGWPYSWCGHDEISAHDAGSAATRLLPDMAEREIKLAAGWAVRASGPDPLFTVTAVRASA